MAYRENVKEPLTVHKLPSDKKLGLLVAEIELRPEEELHIPLGVFNPTSTPKGFSIDVEPNPEEDAIVAQITQIEQNDAAEEWVLLIANYSTTTVSAAVWQL